MSTEAGLRAGLEPAGRGVRQEADPAPLESGAGHERLSLDRARLSPSTPGVGDMAFAWDGGAYATKGDKAILVTAIFTSRIEAIAILKAALANI